MHNIRQCIVDCLKNHFKTLFFAIEDLSKLVESSKSTCTVIDPISTNLQKELLPVLKSFVHTQIIDYLLTPQTNFTSMGYSDRLTTQPLHKEEYTMQLWTKQNMIMYFCSLNINPKAYNNHFSYTMYFV